MARRRCASTVLWRQAWRRTMGQTPEPNRLTVAEIAALASCQQP
jgi:hypothetical protein